MAGRMYSAVLTSNTVSAAKGLFEITAKTNTVVILHSVFVGQSSDAGDAQAEMARIQIVRHDTAAAGSATTITARPHNSNDTAFQGTMKGTNTFAATNAILINESFNVQAGWYYTPTPEERISVHGAKRIAVDLPLAPSDALSIQARITFEEI